jgi:hypothetical protein
MTFLGIRKASRMEYPHWDAGQIGAQPEKVGLFGSGVRWHDIVEPPVREGQVEIIEGETPEESAGRLVDALIADGVLSFSK